MFLMIKQCLTFRIFLAQRLLPLTNEAVTELWTKYIAMESAMRSPRGIARLRSSI